MGRRKPTDEEYDATAMARGTPCPTRSGGCHRAKAKAGTLPNMTGVGQGYEPPEHPDVVVSGSGELDDAVNQLLDALEVTH